MVFFAPLVLVGFFYDCFLLTFRVEFSRHKSCPSSRKRKFNAQFYEVRCMYLFPLLRFCYIPPFPFPFVAISPVLLASGGVYFLINPWFLGMCSAIRGEEGGG